MGDTVVEFEAADVMLPLINKADEAGRGVRARIAALPITAASTAFAWATYFTAPTQGSFYSLVADGGDVYFAFSDSGSDAIDQTITTARTATLCQKLVSGTRWDGRLPDGCTHIIAKTASGTATLRVSLSSHAPTKSRAQGDY